MASEVKVTDTFVGGSTLHVSVCIFVSFAVFYCTSCIAFFFLLLILSIRLSVCLLFMFMGLVASFK